MSKLSFLLALTSGAVTTANNRDYWSQWLESADQTSELNHIHGNTFEEAFNMAKYKIDSTGAKVFRPWSKDMQILSRYMLVNEQCKTNSFQECLIETQEYKNQLTGDQEHLEMLFGQCAQTYHCLPECQFSAKGGFGDCAMQANEKEFQFQAGQLNFSARQLGRQLKHDLQRAVQANARQINSIGQNYAQASNRIMKEVYKCDHGCTDQFTADWTKLNPADTTCACQMPMMFDMPASFLAKKPDMTLYNMIKVEIDFSLRTADSMVFLAADDTAVAPVDATIFELESQETLQLPDEGPPKPAPAPAEPKKEEGDNTLMIEFGLGAAAVVGALLVCMKLRKPSEGEGGDQEHLI